MLAVNDLGEPCAGEPHARFDGRGLETEHPGQGREEEQPSGKLFGSHGFAAYRQDLPPRQSPTLRGGVDVVGLFGALCTEVPVQQGKWACLRS
jgi:hypothetical protein